MDKRKKRIAVVGATSVMAEHCIRLWLQEASLDLSLLGRSQQKLQHLATDLQVRSPDSQINTFTADFLQPEAIEKVVAEISQSGPIDIVLIAHGVLPEQSLCQDDLSVNCDALLVNAVSPVLFAEAFAKQMMIEKQGTLAVIGSVAGDRGRKSNYVYGSAKGLVERYMQGLQHRFAGTAVKAVLIKPGPTDTPMTAELKSQGVSLAPVESVAKTIVKGINGGKSVIYAPAKWRLIMFVLSHLPALIFNKLNI